MVVGGTGVLNVMMETVSDCVAVRAVRGRERREGVLGLEETEEVEGRGHWD